MRCRIADELVSSLELEGTETVLDVGCGTGLLAISVARALTSARGTQSDGSNGPSPPPVACIDLWAARDQIVGLLITLLFAGQHTSSISATWVGLQLLCLNRRSSKGGTSAYLEELLREQEAAGPVLDYDTLHNKMPKLHDAITETLRVRAATSLPCVLSLPVSSDA